MTTYSRLYYAGAATFDPDPLISALEIWAGSVIPLVGPIGASLPAIQFLRAWPMTWNFGSGTLHARSAAGAFQGPFEVSAAAVPKSWRHR